VEISNISLKRGVTYILKKKNVIFEKCMFYFLIHKLEMTVNIDTFLVSM